MNCLFNDLRHNKKTFLSFNVCVSEGWLELPANLNVSSLIGWFYSYTEWFKSPTPLAPGIAFATFEQIEIKTWNFVKAPRSKEISLRSPQHFTRPPWKGARNLGIMEVVQDFLITLYSHILQGAASCNQRELSSNELDEKWSVMTNTALKIKHTREKEKFDFWEIEKGQLYQPNREIWKTTYLIKHDTVKIQWCFPRF